MRMPTAHIRAAHGAQMRGEELSALRRAHRDPDVRLAMIEGPRGAGASALIDAWASELREPVLRIEAGPHTIERLVEAALAELSPVRRARHPARALLAPPRTSDLMAAAERRLRLREETSHLLAELGAVVVIEAMDRAPKSALELVAHLVESGCAFFAITAAAPIALARHPRARTLALAPLDRERVRAFLASPEIVDAVLERTSGLPELIERLVHGEPVPETSVHEQPSAIDAVRALLAHPARAAELALEMADELAARHAEVDAAELLLEAGSLLPAAPLALRARLAELLWIAGDHAQAVAVAERLAAEDPAHAVMHGRLLALMGKHARAIEVLAGASSEEAQAVLADAHYGVGAFERARAMAAPVTSSAIATVALDAENTIAKVEIALGEHASAERRLSAALARALSAELPRHACQALNNLGILALGRGELTAAAGLFHRMIELGAEHGVVYYRGVAHKNLAVALQLEGRYDEALEHAERALAMLAGIADRSLRARVAFNTADLHVVLGDPYRALALVAHAREQGELAAAVEREGLRVEAAAHAELGNAREARARYERAIELGDRSAEAQLGLALLAVDAHEIARATEILERVDASDRRSAARAALVRARLASGDDRVPLARLAVERADATNDPLLGQAPRLALALALESAGLRDRAREEIEALGAREARLLERIPARLRALFKERPLARRIATLERSLGAEPEDRGVSLGALTYERVRRGDGSLYAMRKRIERECIERALRESDGNISRAADLLGMKRPRLSKLVSALGLKTTGTKK